METLCIHEKENGIIYISTLQAKSTPNAEYLLNSQKKMTEDYH